MRILVINYEYPPIGGGGGFVTRDIIEEIVSKGHTATIITSQYGNLNEHEIINGVEIFRVPVLLRNKLEVASFPSMLSFLPSGLLHTLFCRRLHRYDIINTHFAVPCGPLGVALSELLGIPQVLTIHGGDIYDPSKKLSPHRVPLISKIVRWSMEASEGVVAQSSDTRNNAYIYHHPHKHIDIIPLGIKRPSFSKSIRQNYGLSANEIVFCTIGRLVRRKNLRDALLLINRLKKHRPVKLMIIGDGPERANLQNRISQMGLGKEVQMLGNISDEEKFQVLDLSDIYLSTALHEGFGLVFLEAMAFGLPIISYDKGGHTDFLKNNRTGFLSKSGHVEDIMEKALLLIDDRALYGTISAQNRSIVENYFIENCAQRYLDIFEKVIGCSSLSRQELVANGSTQARSLSSRP